MSPDSVMMEIAAICGIAAAAASFIESLIPQAKYVRRETTADSQCKSARS